MGSIFVIVFSLNYVIHCFIPVISWAVFAVLSGAFSVL